MHKVGIRCAGCWDGDTTATLLLFYFSSFTLLLFSIFKTLTVFYSLKSWSSDFHCPMFPLISSAISKVSVLRLSDTQHNYQQCHQWQPTLQAASQSTNPTRSSFRESSIYSKQGGGATVLGEECDVITGETCEGYSLN
jgi:ABC-type transport system involved in multi-copper enzyme maturation permease subunit